MSATTLCKRCGRVITWARTANGKAMPVNPYADDNGNVVLIPFRHQPGYEAKVLKPIELINPPPGPRYMPHFATCGKS